MKKDVVEKIAALMAAAFGLVAALAWNDAIKALFAQIFGESGTLNAMFVYAIVVTVVAVYATIWIGNVAMKSSK